MLIRINAATYMARVLPQVSLLADSYAASNGSNI
jgi:hypothetical protein